MQKSATGSVTVRQNVLTVVTTVIGLALLGWLLLVWSRLVG